MIDYERDKEVINKYVEALNYIDEHYYGKQDEVYCIENDTQAFMDLQKLINEYRRLEKAFKVACGKLEEYNYAIYGLYRITNRRQAEDWEEWCYKLTNE